MMHGCYLRINGVSDFALYNIPECHSWLWAGKNRKGVIPMNTANDLKQLLLNIDRKGYPAYKGTKGSYRFGKYILCIDHVQGDPFAAPSKLHIEVSGKRPGSRTGFMIKSIRGLRCRIIWRGCSRSRRENILFRRRAPARAESFQWPDADRRSWNEAPAP